MLAIDLSFSESQFAEGLGSTVLTASVTTPSSNPIQLNLAWGGSGVIDRDYRTSDAAITILPGQLTGSMTLTAIDDSRTEASEFIEARVAAAFGTTESWSGQPAYSWIVDNDTPWLIQGTSSNDSLVVQLGANSFNYRLNSANTITVSYAQARSLRFSDEPNGGIDTIQVYLANTGSQVTLTPGSLTVEGTTPFDLWSDNIEKQYVNGSTLDTAWINGTPGNDDYWGRPSYSVMTTGHRLVQVAGIRNVTVNGQGGVDRAYLYGNGVTSVDAFVGGAGRSSLVKRSGTAADRSLPFSNVVERFRYVSAYADDVRDTALLNDVIDQDDSFWANSTMAYMLASRNSNYQNTVYDYRFVRAVSTGGNDKATLNDSAGVDLLVASNVQARLTYAVKGVVEAAGFRDVLATSPWNFTSDIVVFSDSVIADIDTTSDHVLERARDDYLFINAGLAQMIYGNRSVAVQGFESLNAHATHGGTDTYSVYNTWFTRPQITGFTQERFLSAARVTQLQATRAYLRNANLFDLRRYTTRGVDNLNPEFSDIAGRLREEWAAAYPTRPPLTSSNIDQVFSLPIYDFSRLETVERRLANVLRQSVLQRLFDEITRNSRNNVERQTAIIEFGHKSIRHTEHFQPLSYDLAERARTGRFVYNGAGVLDPLVLLELAEGRCGQVNKLNADLWHALGFRARLLGVNAHTSGEVFYERQWHYNDSGAFGGKDVPLVPAKPGSSALKIPSFEELSRTPDIIDRLPFYVGAYLFNRMPLGSSPVYASTSYFDNLGDEYFYFEKTAAGDAQAQDSRYYGWNHHSRTPITWIKRAPAVDVGTQPAPAYINAVSTVSNGALGGTATIGWLASPDNYRIRQDSQGNPVLNADGNKIFDWASPTGNQELYSDVVGYRVFVSTTSRGWNYNEYQGTDSVAPAVKAFKANNTLWTPAMYDARYSPAPRDVMTVFVPAASKTFEGQEQVSLRLPTSGTYYVSIMAVDARGLAIGKTNYMLSEEIKITI